MSPNGSTSVRLADVLKSARSACAKMRRRLGSRAVRWPWAHDEKEAGGLKASNISSIHPSLDKCRAGLMDFGQETDAEFTELARGVSDLNSRFTSIREQAEALDKILRQQDDNNILASAYQVYKSSVDLVHSSMGIALSEQQQMAEVEGALTHACSVQETFNRNNLLLRILTMSIRMEASRIDPENRAVFMNVAAAIAEIDDKIAQTTASAFSRIEQVVHEARQERGALHGLEQNLQSRAQSSIDKLQQELAGYKQALIPCADLSCKIGELFAQTTPLNQEIIMSLQYQDIVRQQLEHVASGFDDISSHLQEVQRDGANTAELGFIHNAATVQQAHLTSSREEIEKAGSTVSGGIKQMLVIGEQLITAFNDIEKTAHEIFGHSRISDLFKHEIHQLALIADQSEKANAKISRLVERIDEVVRVFSKEITEHEFEVKIVSLNAQIAAARLSSADALNKLAEESSLAATTNAAATGELTQELQACLGKLQSIKNDADEFMHIVTQEKNEMESRAGEVSVQLADLSVQIGKRSTDVRREFAQIYESQKELLARLRFSALVDGTYAPAIALCGQLRSATHAYALPEDLSANALRKLEAHQNRYTMEREAELHSSVLGKKPASVAKPAPADDGVELFSSFEPEKTAEAPSAEAASQPAPDKPAEPPQTNAPSKKEDLGDGIELF
jgi:hypothetical protein